MRHIVHDASLAFASKPVENFIQTDPACKMSQAFISLEVLTKQIFGKRLVGLPLRFQFIKPSAGCSHAEIHALYPSFDAKASLASKKLMQIQYSHPPLSELEQRLICAYWVIDGEPDEHGRIQTTTTLTYEKNGLIKIKGVSRPGIVQIHPETSQRLMVDEIVRDFRDKMLMLLSEKDRAIFTSVFTPLPPIKPSTQAPQYTDIYNT